MTSQWDRPEKGNNTGRKKTVWEKKGRERGREERGTGVKFLVNAATANRSGREQTAIWFGGYYVTFNLFTFQAVLANISVDILCTYNGFGEHAWDSFWLTEFEQKQVKAIINFLFWEL